MLVKSWIKSGVKAPVTIHSDGHAQTVDVEIIHGAGADDWQWDDISMAKNALNLAGIHFETVEKTGRTGQSNVFTTDKGATVKCWWRPNGY